METANSTLATNSEFTIIAKTLQGLEEMLAKELTTLGANNVQIGTRMVSFTGDKEMLYRANFCLRTAVTVLKPIKVFKAKDADEVYEVVKEMPWDDYMSVKNTILVDSVVFSENFRHSKFVAYRVKDAIADYFRERTGERPNVSISSPDIRINVHIAEDEVTVSLDSSGESLHKRGYRTGSGAAPLNEVLAAGMIMLTGWDGQCDFIDPFCGSGTLLVEAALIAQNIYPGVFREEFGFERWPDFDEDLLERIYNDDSHERDFDHKIYGFDINRQCVSIAQDNARSAGVNRIVEVAQQDFYEFEWNGQKAPAADDIEEEGDENQRKAIIVTNPPYGERITTDDILELYAIIGQRLKQQFAGNDAWILSSHYELFDQIGFRPSTKIALYNGSIPCEMRKYQVFSGKLSERRSEGLNIKTDDERQRNAKFRPLRRRDEDATLDGEKSFRHEGSRDDEHYFKSRPDRKNDFRPRRPQPEPLFEGDNEPEPTRHNFKWGDRSADYVRPRVSGDDARPSRNEHRDSDRGEKKDFRAGDRKDFRAGDRKDFRTGDRKDFKPGNRDFKPGNRDFKPGNRDFKSGNRDFKRADSHSSDRKDFKRDDRFGNTGAEGKPRRERINTKPSWGFDADGRPFRRKDTEE